MLRVRTIAGSVVFGGWLLSAVACHSAITAPREGDARPVTLADFAHRVQADQVNAEDAAVLAAAIGDLEEDPDTPIVWFGEFNERAVLHPAQPGDSVIVDSLVGHVNGRPIFADEFLEPIEDRLLRAAEEHRGVDLQRTFLLIINEWLKEIVLNELILAESEASLSEQEQMGLFAMLNRVYDEEIRKGGGTKSGAESRRRREGDELDQYLGKQKDLVLIDHIRLAKIQPRVVVTWRDIEREYQRRYEEFNPAATVTLARIRVNTETQAALIEDVTNRLAAGESFGLIAEEQGFGDGGLWETFQAGPGGIADIDVSPVMKEALTGLVAGDTSPPFQLGSGTLWLHVVSLEQPRSRSIYDPSVQIGLRNAIRAQRSQIEWQRYIDSLLEEGIHDNLDGSCVSICASCPGFSSSRRWSCELPRGGPWSSGSVASGLAGRRRIARRAAGAGQRGFCPGFWRR